MGLIRTDAIEELCDSRIFTKSMIPAKSLHFPFKLMLSGGQVQEPRMLDNNDVTLMLYGQIKNWQHKMPYR